MARVLGDSLIYNKFWNILSGELFYAETIMPSIECDISFSYKII